MKIKLGMNMGSHMSSNMSSVVKCNEKENTETTKRMIEHWNLGPIDPSTNGKDNADYWKKMAKAWNITEAEARRRLCSNCENSCCSTKCMKEMDAIPENEYDKNAGGRTYCCEFDFICHNLRTCQDWEGEEEDKSEPKIKMMSMKDMLGEM